MKQLILISALLFSFNGWAEEKTEVDKSLEDNYESMGEITKWYEDTLKEIDKKYAVTEEKFCFAKVSNHTNADPEAIIRYNCEEGDILQLSRRSELWNINMFCDFDSQIISIVQEGVDTLYCKVKFRESRHQSVERED